MRIVASVFIGAAVAFASCVVSAQSFPSKPVRIIVPFGSGMIDNVTRLVGEQLSQKWGQPVVIENKPGAGGNIGADVVAHAPPDGYTLLMGGPSVVVNTALYDRVPYVLMKDLVPVTQVANAPFVVVVHPSVPAHTLQELIAYAKANPGKLNYGSGGSGTSAHLSGELLKLQAGLDIVHIPHKGGAATLTELLAGRIQLAVDAASIYLPFIEKGSLRAIAAAQATRIESLPDVPTAREAGLPGFETGAWAGLLAPGGTPPAVMQQISADVASIVSRPDTRAKWSKLGIEAVGSTPEQFGRFMEAELKKWTEVVRASGAKP
ncbi:MAG TPA: tripartite tricarboxylate transporter substrate binding protein [Burkholderiales bacterium]|nr:tripartite tricarboxylate transporter substrate binding protein [Burkholderiales bacterium]